MSNFRGVWDGTWIVGSSNVRWAPPGSERTFQLRIVEVGDRVEAYLIVQMASNLIVNSTLTGGWQSDMVELKGVASGGSNDPRGDVGVVVWFDKGILHGTLAYSFTVPWGIGTETAQGTVRVVSRTAEPRETFEGTWRGRYLVRSCELIEWDHCYRGEVGETMDVELILAQSGDAVTGTLEPEYSAGDSAPYEYRIGVSGLVVDGTLRLTGVSPFFPLNARSTLRLLSFAAVRDVAGRMTGEYTWQDDYNAVSGLHRITRSGELVDVVQVR